MTITAIRRLKYGRGRSLAIGLAAAVAVNGWIVVPFVQKTVHRIRVDSMGYRQKYGHWDTVNLPRGQRVNAVHATLLDTGKILITAGSGNDRAQFKAGKFKTLLYDPDSGSTKLVFTPSDMFCGGQALLSDGRVLIAGGTQNYEVLAKTITHAGGIMTIKNESPDGATELMPTGTELVGTNGKKYRTDAAVYVAPARKKFNPNHTVTVVASTAEVWVNAEQAGTGSNLNTKTVMHFSVTGLAGRAAHQVYGLAHQLNMNKQEYQGTSFSYTFDPQTETYSRTADMNVKRWYPTLTPLSDGQVLAVSGLDGTGRVNQGKSAAEIFDPATNRWTSRPELTKFFPTYPALFATARPNVLFYSGSNSGYGPATAGRQPGLWNVRNDQFTPVGGLRDPQMTETSGSAWVGPVQDQRIAIVGGGGVGDSNTSTRRIDTVDLKATHPRYVPGPLLPQGTRYPLLVTLPDDTMLISGGGRDYRGQHASDNHTARIYHPLTNTLSFAAAPNVARDYHSESLLLPDGRVITMGSNPQYSDKKDTILAPFEQRLEIYTPAYLYRGPRPVITKAPGTVQVGATMTVQTPDAATIATARLIRPGAATHVTNLEQRSVALRITRQRGALRLTVSKSGAIMPPGYYLLFLVNAKGVPSVASWVRVI